ncbi:uncharacterized protein BJX67DRAFT_28622 [Aspergillus lucknowensis]|uniref:Uncharacterized protein n=1 Tax=Aspergillus lucknowensis TaxID=176173 RepID=A0ABR4LY42_9EURO
MLDSTTENCSFTADSFGCCQFPEATSRRFAMISTPEDSPCHTQSTLFQDPGSRVESFAPERPRRWLALLYTNQQISKEASAVLYGVNHFAVEETGPLQHQGSLLKSLDRIGPANAGFLSHLSITFPALREVEAQSGKIELAQAGLQNLNRLQTKCSRLRTFETLVYGQGSSNPFQEDLEKNESIQEVLIKVNAQLRAIGTLENITVKFCSGSPSPSVRDFLRGLAWVVLPYNSGPS